MRLEVPDTKSMHANAQDGLDSSTSINFDKGFREQSLRAPVLFMARSLFFRDLLREILKVDFCLTDFGFHLLFN